MIQQGKLIFVSGDDGLLQHWRRSLDSADPTVFAAIDQIQLSTLTESTTVWVDMDTTSTAHWSSKIWKSLFSVKNARVVAASSNPKELQAIEALDAGCAAYTHAFADAATLLQIQQTVQNGQIWVGKQLMQRLVQSAKLAAATELTPKEPWHSGLTEREREVAWLAANGASNQQIAQSCEITERTVKAHLSASFTKLNLTDRLQLALRVHGIS